MSFKAELILVLCLLWGWSHEMMPSDLCLVLLWLVLGLKMKGNGFGNTNAVVCPPRAPAYVQVPYPMDCCPAGRGEDVRMGGCPPEVPSLGGRRGKRLNTQLQPVYLFENGWCLHLSWTVERLSSPADAKPRTGLCFPIPQKTDHPVLP